MKLLIVDDEIVALNALHKRVDWVEYGYSEVFLSLSADEAKKLLEKEKIDLILCDVEMPGESGLSLIEYVHDNFPNTKSIMVTCHEEFSYIQKAMRLGARDYILKPIDYDELKSLLLDLKVEHDQKESRKEIDLIVARTKEPEAIDYDLEKDTNEKRISRVKQYVEDHINEKILVRDLAEEVHINEQHLMRIFKRSEGQSLNEYITDRRIIIAGNMLKDTDYSINFIADCVGCDNYSYFTKLFKKQTGFTPREYRAQFKME